MRPGAKERLAVLAVIGALVVGACGSSDEPASPVPSSPTQDPDPVVADPVVADPVVADPVVADPVVPADACARARGCCPAYAAALPNAGERGTAEQACASLEIAIAAGGPPADEACQGALDGFRRSLEATGREIPPECR